MNQALKALITFMLSKKYIGGKHTQEDRLVKSKTKWLQQPDCSDFKKEYKQMLTDQYFIRLKKRTGKGYDWHISLNPRKLKQLYTLLE